MATALDAEHDIELPYTGDPHQRVQLAAMRLADPLLQPGEELVVGSVRVESCAESQGILIARVAYRYWPAATNPPLPPPAER